MASGKTKKNKNWLLQKVANLKMANSKMENAKNGKCENGKS